MPSCRASRRSRRSCIYYGETFPAFIEEFDAGAPLPYLADVARLEFARGRAYHAADVEPLPRAAFAALPAGRSARARVTLHPSVGIIASRFPVCRSGRSIRTKPCGPCRHWGAEAVLVARPCLKVETQCFSLADAFLLALQAGSTIAEAVERGGAAASDFNASDSLAVLIGAHLVVGLDEV